MTGRSRKSDANRRPTTIDFSSLHEAVNSLPTPPASYRNDWPEFQQLLPLGNRRFSRNPIFFEVISLLEDEALKKFALVAGAASVLFAGVAAAADLPARAYSKAPVLAAQVNNWTGFYAGVELGAQLSDNEWRTTGVLTPQVNPSFANANADFDRTAFRGGIYLGYNYQLSPNWLIGLEGDISGLTPSQRTLTGIPGTITAPGFVGAVAVGNPDRATAELAWDASIRARLGVLVSPNVLLYGTGGVAFADAKYTAACGTPAFPVASWCGAPVPRSETHSSILTGWTAGAGAEAFVAPNWILRGEYRYSEYGSRNHVFFANSAADTVWATTRLRTHDAMVGIAYKFGGPVVAKY